MWVALCPVQLRPQSASSTIDLHRTNYIAGVNSFRLQIKRDWGTMQARDVSSLKVKLQNVVVQDCKEAPAPTEGRKLMSC